MRRKSKETKMSGRTWWYVSKYVNPEQTINDINREYGTIDSSPVFFGFWVKVVLYKVALKDVQENLHSLIEERTCTCGLTLRSDQEIKSILTHPRHRNHKTLEIEPNPKFRGKVGKRISMPMQRAEWQHPVDVLWDELITAFQK
jgi:hypothetical protein